MSNIKVVVRPRPVDESRKEKWASGFEIHGRRLTMGTKTYDPDICLSHQASQDEVFSHALPIIDAVKDGNNGTILVYGQTGTGKTHTMIGGEEGVYDGITIKAIDHLLDHVRDRTVSGSRIALSLSVLEIYNERVMDMLSGSEQEVPLINGFPRNTISVTVSSTDDAVRTVSRALESRRVASTAMNDRSSRSHVIFMLDLSEVDDENQAEVTHLFLVDLAGSESIKKSQVTGKAAQEAGMINKSLLALKNVILTLSNAAAQGPTSRPHVPYRDSRLTELLQDSIGGSARTMFIACISPNGRDMDETKSTLEYATKARSIRNVSNTERDKLLIRIRGLEFELQKYKNRESERVSEKGGYFVSKEEHESMLRDVEDFEGKSKAIEVLEAEVRNLKARHEVDQSASKVLREMLEEKSELLQRTRAMVAHMVMQFHATLRASESACNNAIAATQQAVSGMCDVTSERIAEAGTCLDAQLCYEENEAAIKKMWLTLNTRATHAVRRVCDAHFKLCDQMRLSQANQTKRVREAIAHAATTLSHELQNVESVVESTATDINMDIVASRAVVDPMGAELDLTDHVTIRHAVENTVERTRKVIQGIQPPQVDDGITNGFLAIRRQLSTTLSVASREALSQVSGIDIGTASLPSSPTQPRMDGSPTTAASTTDVAVISPTRGRGARTARALFPRPTTNEAPSVFQPKRPRSMPSDTGLESLRRKPTLPNH